MTFKPLHDRVLVERQEPTEKTTGGIFIPISAKEKPAEGKVIAVGEGIRKENGTILALNVKVDDKILFAKYCGNEVTIDGKDYIIMKESDILGILN